MGLVLLSFGVVVRGARAEPAAAAGAVTVPLRRPTVGEPANGGRPAARPRDGDRNRHPEPSHAHEPTPGDEGRFLNALEACDRDGGGEIDGHLEKLLEALGPDVSARVLIATVPDPMETSFGAAFDAALSSLRAALSTLGYASGSYYLPWSVTTPASAQADAQPDGPSAPAVGGGNAGSETSRLGRSLGACVPGILIFRKVSVPATSRLKQVAIVLLVGETPAAGVATNALGQALAVARRLGRDERLLILGPAFSGSAPSLRTALDAWTGANAAPRPRPAEGNADRAPDAAAGQVAAVPRFEIVTGSATSPSVARAVAADDARFAATVVPDNVQTCAMYRFLDERVGVPMKDVALLTESNTTFGAFFFDFACTAIGGKRLKPRVVVPFPLHISDLRVAEERRLAARPGASAASGTGPQGIDPLLDVRTVEGHQRMDSLPAMSPEIAALEAQLDLAEQFGTLCRQGIRALGILASDVRDVTVLGAEAKRQCPRLMLFTLGPDRILLHSQYSDLEGMLVASTYPLHASASSWTYPHLGRDLVRTFPSEKAQGVFNAALLLLGDTRSLLDYGPLGPEAAGGGADEVRPSVWISAVGRDGFWPIAAFPYGDGDRGYVRRARAPANAAVGEARSGRQPATAETADEGETATDDDGGPWRHRFAKPFGFVFLLLAMQAFAWLNLGAFLIQSNPREAPSRRSSAWGWLDPYRAISDSVARRRALAVVCAFLVLLLMNVGALLLYVIPGYMGDEPAMRVGAFFASVTCAALVAVMVAVVTCSPCWHDNGERAALRRRFVATFAIGCVWFSAIIIWILPRVARLLGHLEPDLTLFFERTTNVTSGFSPASGAVLYGLCLLGAAIAELNRLRLIGFASDFEAACFPLVTDPLLKRKLESALRTGLEGLLFVAAMTVAVVVAARGDYHPPFEGRWLGDLFGRAGAAVVASMIALQLIRFARTWAVIRRLFQEELERPDAPRFRKQLRPFFLRLLQRPLDPTLGRTIIAHVRAAAAPIPDPRAQEAVRVLVLASYGRAHLHNFLTFMTGAGFALILLSTSYPFKMWHSTDILTWAVVASVITVALFVLITMNRDEVLSRISGTAPGRISLDRTFTRTVLIHIGLPLLGLAATRFTTVAVLFGKFVKPLMQLFGGLAGD